MHLLHVPRLSTFRYLYSYIITLSSALQTCALSSACNTARYFISTNLTLPHARHFHDYGISTISRSRPVHSDFCQRMSPRILSIGILWTPDLTSPTISGSDLPYTVVADAFSRLQRAVSVPENALCFLQRSIRGSVSRRYPIIPLLEISVRKISLSVTFTPLQE